MVWGKLMGTGEHGALTGPCGKRRKEQGLKLPTTDGNQAAVMEQVYLKQVITLQCLPLDGAGRLLVIPVERRKHLPIGASCSCVKQCPV